MQSIIDKYLFAVVKHLDIKKRESVKKELNSLIWDMLEERTNGREIQEEDVYAVLEQIGKPSDLAEKYMGEGKTSLLEGIYFRYYKRVLLLVLPLVAIVTVAVSYMSNILDHGDWSKSVRASAESVIYGVFFFFFVITVIFVILQRWNIKFSGEDIRSLPDVPTETKKSINIKSILSIVAMFTLGLITFLQPSLLFYAVKDGEKISVLNEPVFLRLRYIIIAMLVVLLIRECSVIVNKFLSVKLYVWLTLLDVINLVLFFVLFLRAEVINPKFTEVFEAMFPDKQIIQNFFSYTNYWIAGVFFLLVLFDNLSDLHRIER